VIDSLPTYTHDHIAFDGKTYEIPLYYNALDDALLMPIDSQSYVDPTLLELSMQQDSVSPFEIPSPTSSSSSYLDDEPTSPFPGDEFVAPPMLEAFESAPQLQVPRSQQLKQPALSKSDEPKRHVKKRVAHNLVEKKYRNTLNNEMERLRQAIPHMANLDDQSPIGRPKPSKMAVLASAVDYIRSVETECEQLRSRNEEMRVALRAIGSRTWRR